MKNHNGYQSPKRLLRRKPEFFYSPQKLITLTREREIPSTMASHHHQCHPTTTTTSSAVCYRCYCCPNYPPSLRDPVPDPHPLHHHPPPHTNFYTPCPNGLNPNPPYTNQNFHHHHHHEQLQHNPAPTGFEEERYFQQLRRHQQGELTHTHPVVSSLLRRIAALESSLRRHSSSRSLSLRDAAARTIQVHFRAFLVRRSRTLRQLKDLASIKSTLNILKSSVSETTHFDPQSISRKALKLLLKLDSIQGGDPMIRHGKRSISKELNRFLDLIDGIILKKSEISTRLVRKNVSTKKSGGLYSDHNGGTVGTRSFGKNKKLEDLVDRIDELYTEVPMEDDEEDLECPEISIIERNAVSRNRAGSLGKRQDGVEAKAKKSVSFVENGKVYKVHRSRYEPVSSRDCDSDDESDSVGAKGELEEDVQRKAGEIRRISLKETVGDEEDQSQDGEYTKGSDGEGGPMYELRTEDDSFTFSAPLPVTMETRTDMMDKRKTVKIVE